MTEPNQTPETKGYFISVRFRGGEKTYYFSTRYGSLKEGDQVVVDTINGFEIATVTRGSVPLSEYRSELELKPIVRIPDSTDLNRLRLNESMERNALAIVQSCVKRLNLPMDLLEAIYSLNGDHLTITYTSSERRVDFRELLHLITPVFPCRIELRQLANRDRAKSVGGLGICGLPLCCSTFLTSFEGISIQRAKNQMLTINIPKLSGPCGKLICCLLYEDDAYTEAKKEFPTHGSPVHTPDGDYTVHSFNILSKTVTLISKDKDDFKTYSLEDILAMKKGTYRKKAEEPKSEELPDFGIRIQDPSYDGYPDPQQNQGNQPQQKQNKQGKGKGHNPGGNPQNKGNNNPSNKNNPSQKNPNQKGNPQQNRPQQNQGKPKQNHPQQNQGNPKQGKGQDNQNPNQGNGQSKKKKRHFHQRPKQDGGAKPQKEGNPS